MQVGRMFINREMETVRGWHYAGDFQSCQQSGDRCGRSYSNLAVNSRPLYCRTTLEFSRLSSRHMPCL
jgi:hypothetical protein